MTDIYLLRHGKVNGRAALYGKTDIEVAPSVNKAILTTLIKHQQLFSQVLTSPLKRCAELAELFATQAHKPLETMNDMQEMNFGSLDGICFDDLPYLLSENKGAQASHRFKPKGNSLNIVKPNSTLQKFDNWQALENFWQSPDEYPLPEAETLANFNARIKAQWQILLKRHQNHSILLVSHGGVIRMILAEVLGLDWRNAKLFSQLTIRNASFTHIYHDISADLCHVKAISHPLSSLATNQCEQ